MANQANEQNYSTVGGVATNADFSGHWVLIDQCDSIGFIAKLTATSSPVAAWEAYVTNYDDPTLDATPTQLTLTSDMTAQNPDGTTTDRNFLFQFDPCPRAKWMKFVYNRSSGGSASLLLNISMNKKAKGT